MEHQFSFQFEDPKEEQPSTKEEILNWPPEVRDSKYKDLIGQRPFALTGEQVAEGILNPEAEKLRVLQRNRGEDSEDAVANHRR